MTTQTTFAPAEAHTQQQDEDDAARGPKVQACCLPVPESLFQN